MAALCGVAQCFPETWIGRNIVFVVLFFGLVAYAALDTAVGSIYREIDKITVRLDNVSREVESVRRGLENVHDRLWKAEHKDDASCSYDDR